jgi:hypothetical protein
MLWQLYSPGSEPLGGAAANLKPLMDRCCLIGARLAEPYNLYWSSTRSTFIAEEQFIRCWLAGKFSRT